MSVLCLFSSVHQLSSCWVLPASPPEHIRLYTYTHLCTPPRVPSPSFLPSSQKWGQGWSDPQPAGWENVKEDGPRGFLLTPEHGDKGLCGAEVQAACPPCSELSHSLCRGSFTGWLSRRVGEGDYLCCMIGGVERTPAPKSIHSPLPCFVTVTKAHLLSSIPMGCKRFLVIRSFLLRGLCSSL